MIRKEHDAWLRYRSCRGSLMFVHNVEVFVALQFEVAMTTSGGRAKFVESMEGIVKGVKQVR